MVENAHSIKSITCATQDCTVLTKSVQSKLIHSEKWHSRVPASVTLDISISSDALRVYNILALKTFGGDRASLGMRQLGKLIGTCAQTARTKLAELISAGHVEILKSGDGKRNEYKLLRRAVVPVEKTKQEETPLISSPAIMCHSCNKPRPGISKDGNCRDCREDLRIKVLMKDHPDWTAEQVTNELKNGRKIKTVARKMKALKSKVA